MIQKSILMLIAVLALGTLHEAWAFTCGPNMSTYRVRAPDGRAGNGVRCVAVGAGSSTNQNLPAFVWYGEGVWGNVKYKHVGHAFWATLSLGRRRPFINGWASDIFGSGEATRSNFNGNLTLSPSAGNYPPASITVSGAWNEIWDRMANGAAAYTSALPRTGLCGDFLDSLHVEATGPNYPLGRGLRCILTIGPAGYRSQGGMTWYGEGFWNNKFYSHIGYRGLRGHGAIDICEQSRFNFCGVASLGSLNFSTTGDGFNIGGAWSEHWFRSRAPVKY